MSPLLTTIVHRPYVFAFLVTFLVIGILNEGLRRTLVFLVLGFLVAFLSEVSSIQNGFPYGMYHYVYENMPGEIILLGVPVWDSLSYAFLAFAAYETAVFFIGPRRSIRLIAPILMLLLDVVVDPLAVRGDRWFLGRIFYYPDAGDYFGVPLSNFLGWFLVAAVIINGFLFVEKRWIKTPAPRRRPWLGPAFYWGILVFNLVITFGIGEIRLGLIGLAIHLIALFLFISFKKRCQGKKRLNEPPPFSAPSAPIRQK